MTEELRADIEKHLANRYKYTQAEIIEKHGISISTLRQYIYRVLDDRAERQLKANMALLENERR